MVHSNEGQTAPSDDQCRCNCQSRQMMAVPPDSERVHLFWEEARKVVGLTDLDIVLGTNTVALVEPPAWQYSADAEVATELARKTVSGEKTVTSTPMKDYEMSSQPLPEVGDLGIVCDGHGEPVALVRTTGVSVVPFDEVLEETARAEGEPSLAIWRDLHGAYLGGHQDDLPLTSVTQGQEVPSDDMVIEIIECIYPEEQ